MQATLVGNDRKTSSVLNSNEEKLDVILPNSISQIEQTASVRRRTTETASEFLAKKREIFLVQMSLDTKRAEICKLEERAQHRENALKRSEDMLEEDAMRFDAFLKENDTQVQQALKRAENEAKRKQEKVSEIKQLNTEITAIRSEVNKAEEQMEDFLQYKKFLDDVTPPEWFANQKQKREKNKEEKMEYWKRQCEAIKKRKSDATASKNKAELEYNNARTQQEAEATKLLKEPPKPTENELEDGEEEDESYFSQPQQLLDLYTSLEEQNLFLIQNLQETEEALDKNRTKLTETMNKMDSESDALQHQIAQLKQQRQLRLQRQKQTRNTLPFQPATFSCTNQTQTSVPWESLESKLKEVYNQCGFIVDRGVGMLAMLTNLEMKLEDQLRTASVMPKDLIDRSERAREKERRKISREEKQAQQKREHEARIKRALQRAEAPAFKKTGRPEMFRSIIPRRKRVVLSETKQDENHELAEFLSKDLI
eukprot:g4245.t1